MDIKILASGSAGNCYWVSDGTTELLIECGISWRKIQQALDFQTSKIHACLISHEHQDHAKAVRDLMKAGIDCWGSAGTFESLAFDMEAKPHRLNTIAAVAYSATGSWDLRAFHVEHDAADPLGFLLDSRITGERLLYCTDTAYVHWQFDGLTHIMIEANYSLDLLKESIQAGTVPAVVKPRIMQSHFSLENVVKMLRANDLRKVQAIYLLHLSRNNADRDRFKKRVQEATGKVVIVA